MKVKELLKALEGVDPETAVEIINSTKIILN